MSELLSSPLDASQIGLQATVQPVPDNPKAVRVLLRIDPADLHLEQRNGHWTGILDLAVHLESSKQKVVQLRTISIDRADTIKLNNQLVDAETLTASLIELRRSNPDLAVVIRPDRELPVQKLVTLMDALQRAQIMKVGIATKAEAK